MQGNRPLLHVLFGFSLEDRNRSCGCRAQVVRCLTDSLALATSVLTIGDKCRVTVPTIKPHDT